MSFHTALLPEELSNTLSNTTFDGAIDPNNRNVLTEIELNRFAETISNVPVNRSNLIFNLENSVPVQDRMNLLEDHLGLNQFDTMRMVDFSRDQIGMAHHAYQYFHQGLEVEGAIFKVHSRGGQITHLSGDVDLVKGVSLQADLDELQAFDVAKNHSGGNQFIWDVMNNTGDLSPNEQQLTERPEGELLIYRDPASGNAFLSYKFDIYAVEPDVTREYVYVNANNGDILATRERIHAADAPVFGSSHYNSGVSFFADNTGGSNHRLRQTTYKVETYDLNGSTNPATKVDITSSFPSFTDPSHKTGVQAHFGAEQTQTYFKLEHGRDSYDNAGATLQILTEYDVNLVGGFWDGTYLNLGEGDGVNWGSQTSIDFVAHEFGHAVTEYSANLAYMDESGALNESFSDIFGESVEAYFNGTADYRFNAESDIAASVGVRNLANPNEFSDPDTYLGTHWYTGTLDNGGVHTNSGVQNFWFYLLAEGGSGTNDNSDAYNVTGIGIDDAAAIAYRNLTTYLGVNSQYADARVGAVQSAIDLFGESSPQHVATAEAWDAVGVYGSFALRDDYGYTSYRVPTGYVFEDISGTGTTLLSAGDDVTAEITDAQLGGFTYNHYGTEYSNLFASSNGLITFGSANNAFNNTDLSGSSVSQAAIAPLWDDYDLDLGGDVFWQVKGTGLNERLIVQWNNVEHTDGVGAVTFQAVLYEFNDSVQFNYLDGSYGNVAYDQGASATIGIKDVGSVVGMQHLASLNTVGTAVDMSSTLVSRSTNWNSFGYNAWIADYSFDDISATGNSAGLTGGDNSLQLTPAQLGNFVFKFYGTDYTDLFVSTNGLITFGSGVSSPFNSNLLSTPAEAAIAVLWDDLSVIPGSNFLYQVKGTGENQRLILQWEDVFYSNGNQSEPITFQAILHERDGSIELNYLDISDSTAAGRSQGLSATQGIKNDNTTGADPMLSSLNVANSWFMGDMRSVRIMNNTMFGYEGGTGNDLFEVNAYNVADAYQVLVNGTEFILNKSQYDFINLDMVSGANDVLNMNNTANTAGYEDIYMWRYRAQMVSGEGTLVTVNGADDQNGQSKLDSSAFFYDGASSDDFRGLETFAFQKNINGFAYNNRIDDAGQYTADASGLGGVDTNLIRDAVGNDAFSFNADTTDFSIVYASGVTINAIGFQSNLGLTTGGGVNTGTFFDGPGNDVLYLNSNQAIMQSLNYKTTVVGLDDIAGDATGGAGTDKAIFYDTSGNDTATVNHGGLTEFNGSTGFHATSNGFENTTISALSNGIDSVVVSTPTTTEHTLQVLNATTKLISAGLVTELRRFDDVTIYLPFVLDQASLYGSAGGDTLYSKEGFAELTRSGGEKTTVYGANETNVYGSGGFDQAFVQDSTGNDSVLSFFNRTTFTRSNDYLFVRDFEFVDVNSFYTSLGGTDTFEVRDSNHNDDQFTTVLLGADATMIWGGGNQVLFNGFDTVNALAFGGGNNDTADIANGETFTVNLFAGWENII